MTDNEIQYRTASQCVSPDYCRGWNDASMQAEEIVANKNADIAMLIMEKEKLEKNLFNEQMSNKRNSSEVDRLTDKNKMLRESIALMIKNAIVIGNVKSEAIKEFAEKLKEGIPPWLYPYVESVAKEMVGE